MTGGDLLQRLADTYGALGSYSDTGVVSRILTAARRRRVDTGMFTTRFERGGRFRFDYRSDGG